jgi:APA family basic amino acid/polyamine antiporter
LSADGMFFGPIARIDARTGAPQFALVALGAWAIVLILSGSFNALLNYTTVGEWLSHAFGIATIFWYRKKLLSEPSPYLVPGYPWLPLVFTTTVLCVIAATAVTAPADAGMSLVIIAIGVPVYYLWRRRAVA